MEYIYAALLLHKAGKEINENNLKKVLEAAGINVEEARIKALVAALEGVNIEEVIEEAKATPVVTTAAAPVSEEKKEEKVEEKKEEKKEEEGLTGLSALFG